MAKKVAKKKQKAVTKKVKERSTEQVQFDIEWVAINSIKLWGDNPRMNDKAAKKLAEIIKDHGIKSPIVCWDKNRTIYKGNTTYKACKILGMKKVPVVFHSFPSETAAKAYGIADNKAGEYSEWDEDILTNMMGSELKDSDYNLGFSSQELNLLNSSGDEDELYTAKVETPVYEITGKKPKITDLYDDTKARKLIKAVKNSDLPKEVQTFLIKAAYRHIVFDYGQIAEYYAHADEILQDLMEDSALIIVDYDKAIELGHVKLSKDLGRVADADSEENNNG